MKLTVLFCLSSLFLAACPSSEKDDTSGSETNQPVDQSTECADYMACVLAATPGAVADADAAYGQDGTCWADQESADLCTQACVAAMADLGEVFPEEKACGGSPASFETITTAWDSQGVSFDIRGGNGRFDLGMAETDPRSPDPWTGEDCLNGYTAGDGTLYLYCHPLSATGGYLASGGVLGFLDEANETLFSQDYSSVITYAIWDENGACWTWGHDTSYYLPEGCTDIN